MRTGFDCTLMHRVFAVAVGVLLVACRPPVGVTRVSPSIVTQELTQSALNSSSPNTFSQNVLHRRNLTERFRRDPEGALEALHQLTVQGRGRENTPFALAELSFRYADSTGKRSFYLEAVVCANNASQKAVAALAEGVSRLDEMTIPLWQSGDAADPDELVVVSHNWDEIRRLLWDYVGIVRTNKRLQRARSRIARLQEEIQEYYWDFRVTNDLLELRNIATVAELIIACALQRPESRGLHYNLDHLAADPAWAQRDTRVQRPFEAVVEKSSSGS